MRARVQVQIKPVQACVRAQVRLRLESCCIIVRVRFGVRDCGEASGRPVSYSTPFLWASGGGAERRSGK